MKEIYTYKKNNKGFTLVEMIVVLAILVILLSTSVMGLLAWQDWADFNRENEYAQSLFIAAQNQLSEYSAGGKLEMLKEEFLDESASMDERQYNEVGLNITDSISMIKDENGEAYNLDKIYSESEDKIDKKLYQGEIVSIRARTGQYEQYLDNPAEFKKDNPEAYWVFELVSAYIYDSSILNGQDNEMDTKGAAICIEFSPESGQVFSVLYSDKNDSFVYEEIEKVKASNRVADISDRTEDIRREKKVGYYGVDTLSKATRNDSLRPSISEVKLFNRDTFYMTIRLSSKYATALSQKVTYVMDLDNSKSANDKKLTVKLDGTKLKNKKNASAIYCPVIRYDEEGNEEELGELPIFAWIEPDLTVHVVYDAADIQASIFTYEDELSKLYGDVDAYQTAKFRNTFSFFRFGVASGDVYASVHTTGGGYGDSKIYSNFGHLNPFKNQDAKNTCFAGQKIDANTASYSIGNARHLYNVRYVEDISYDNANKYLYSAGIVDNTTFKLTDNVDWEEFQKAGELYDSYDYSGIYNISDDGFKNVLADIDGNPIELVTRFNCGFPSIATIREKDVFDGNDYTIKGITSTEAINALFGDYTVWNNSKVEVSKDKSTGFINTNYGTIKNLKLDKVYVSGSTYVGGITGINAGEVSNLCTLNTDEKSLVIGRENVGGIIGFQMPTKENLVIDELENAAAVSGVKAVGGIVGMVRNDFTNINIANMEGLSPDIKRILSNPNNFKISIEKCTNAGAVVGVNSSKIPGIYVGEETRSRQAVNNSNNIIDTPDEARYIGGIVGYMYNSYSNADSTDRIVVAQCTSAPVYNKEKLIDILGDTDKLYEKLNGVYVGGIAGYNYFGEINECYTSSIFRDRGYLFGYKYVGGIVGYNIGPASGIDGINGSKQGVNNNHVIAYDYAGGITGCNAGVQDKDSLGNNISAKGDMDPEKLEGLLVPDSERSLYVKVSDWINRGVIIAVNEYSGGITGYNAGYIYKCNSDVLADEVELYFNEIYSGNYAGGITGYNNGFVTNTKYDITDDGKNGTATDSGSKLSAISYVKGHNYVGGVVGYNDVDSVVENYEIASGYVLGDENSCFVGGYAGFNASTKLLMDKDGNPIEIVSNPNNVEGDYFVGGCIGGNFINTADYVPPENGPVDPDPDEPDVPVVDENCYATFTLNRIPNDSELNQYCQVGLSVNIHNNTGRRIKDWSISVDRNIHLDYEPWDNQIIVKDNSDGTYTITPNVSWNKLVYKDDTIKRVGGYNAIAYDKSTLEDLIELTQQKFPVSFEYADTNSISLLSEEESFTNKLDVDFVLENDNVWDDGANKRGGYKFIVKNLTEETYKNWRIELPLTSECIASDFYSIQGEVSNGKIILKPFNEWHFINPKSSDGTITATFQLVFKSQNDFAAFLNTNIKIYNGNELIYQKGADDPSKPDIPIAPVEPDIEKIITRYRTDNGLGQLNGKAFVGGYAGYNIVMDNANDGHENGYVYDLQLALISALLDKQSLEGKFSVVENIDSDTAALSGITEPVKTSDMRMEIYGIADTTTGNTNNLGSISGNICIGGVLGYGAKNTKLLIKNVQNASRIIADTAIATDEQQGRRTAYNGKAMNGGYIYSYSGAIVGKVNENTTIDNCSNTISASVQSEGTYTGALCEVNDGNIINCSVVSFGSSVDDYVGGISGLNKGTISNCSFKNSTVSGRNVVGGITAENFGIISNIDFEKPSMLVAGISTGDRDGVTGLFAGYNGSEGIITVENDINGVNIVSGGRYVGGLVGYNEGQLYNAKVNDAFNIDNNLLITGYIEGYQIVGGFIGCNNDPDDTRTIKYYTNKANVIANYGDAGGIIGVNSSNNGISYCANISYVAAPNSGNAGGITSINYGSITGCYDFKTVNAPKGMSGGIVAVNGDANRTKAENIKAVITNCVVKNSDIEPAVSFASAVCVGGVASLNSGIIKNNTLKNVRITNYKDSTPTNMGIVVGVNLPMGEIILTSSENTAVESISNSRLVIETNKSCAGGIAGRNEGKIYGESDEMYKQALVNVDISLESEEGGSANYANIGGVTGVNTGTIENISVMANINGKLGSETSGYGGIAGYSGYSSIPLYNKAKENDEDYYVGIKNCSFDGKIHGTGSSGAPVRIGGIVGINGYGSRVEACLIGIYKNDTDGIITEESQKTSITAGDISKKGQNFSDVDNTSYSSIGGITGENYGYILACDNEPYSTDRVDIIGFTGEAAGVAGYNYSGAVISGYIDNAKNVHWLSTGENWYIDQRCAENDHGPAGIMGICLSAEDIKYVKNYANIEIIYRSNNKAGGIIAQMEQRDEPYVVFDHVENYGDIYGARSVGGFVGIYRESGAKFKNCTNYGELKGGYEVGGFVGNHHMPVSGFSFTSCENHGNITLLEEFEHNNVRAVAGFVGYVANTNNTSFTYSLYDCVNTGTITREASTTRGSNYASFIGYNAPKTYLENCRNYNTNALNANGFVGNGGSAYYKNCFDNSNLVTGNANNTPFGGVLNSMTNGYYLDSNSEKSMDYTDYGVYFSLHFANGTNPDIKYTNSNFRNYKNYSSVKNPEWYLLPPTDSLRYKAYSWPQYNFGLSYGESTTGGYSQGIDSLYIYLWNGADNSDSVPLTYTATAYFTYSDGSVIKKENLSGVGAYDAENGTPMIIENPSQDAYPVNIRVNFDSQTVYMLGYTYKAKEASDRELSLHPSNEQFDTSFNLYAEAVYPDKCSGGVVQQEGVENRRSIGFGYRGINGESVLKNELKFSNQSRYIDDYLDYNYYRYKKDDGELYCYEKICMERNGGIEPDISKLSYDLTINVRNGLNSTGMNKLVFYLANDNQNPNAKLTDIKYMYYDYSVTFTDCYGNSVETQEYKDILGSHKIMDGRQEISVPEGLDKRISKIVIHIRQTGCIKNGIEQGNDGRVYLSGLYWIPYGESKEYKLSVGPNKDSYEMNMNRLYVDYNSPYSTQGEPYVYKITDYANGFLMNSSINDPINTENYYGDKLSYVESNTEGGTSGSRIDIYKDIDPKILDTFDRLYLSRNKLQTPDNLKVTADNSQYIFTWDEVKEAYAYEVRYRIVDEAGNNVMPEIYSEPEMIQSNNRVFTIDVDDSWVDNKYALLFEVRSVNGYHDYCLRNGGDVPYDTYDSDWSGSEKITTKRALPEPEFYLEVVEGNRTVIVIENYERYKEEGCEDFTFELTFDKKNYTFNVGEVGKYSEPMYIGFTTSGNVEYMYKAVPNESISDYYVASASHKELTKAHNNSSLPTCTRFCTTSFNGFFGTNPDSMTYDILFTVGNVDSYMTTDISAYDSRVGATVTYCTDITHTANSDGKTNVKMTSTMKNLPTQWFSDENIDEITVRAYLYRSQYNVVRYGHEVAQNIVLDGTAEENRAVLQAIVDSNYFAADEVKLQDNYIWDAASNDLKEGYVLQKQEDGTYSVYYSSVLAMSMNEARIRREENGESYRKYYKYSVDYAIYRSMSSETNGSVLVNSVDYGESYWLRYEGRYNNNQTGRNEMGYIGGIQPSPILDGQIGVAYDEEGKHKVYSLTWDKYYKDVVCFNTGISPQCYNSTSTSRLTKAPYGMFATWDAYSEKAGKANLSNVAGYDNLNTGQKRDIMNAYYMGYSTASYTVQLIGTTIDGERVLLDSKEVSTPDNLGTISSYLDGDVEKYLYTYDNRTQTSYEVFGYSCKFTDENDTWANYPLITARIIRNGSLESVYIYGKRIQSSTYGATYALPRYKDYSLNQLLNLGMIAKPSVTLTMIDGRFNTNELLYNVEWGAVTNSYQLNDLGGYLITVELNTAADENKRTDKHYYYVEEVANPNVNDTIGLDLSSLSGEVIHIDEADYIKNNDTRSVVIDLSDFNSNDIVDISVKAIARRNAEYYTDGIDGEKNVITILARLNVPDIVRLSSYIDGIDGEIPTMVSMEDYKKGISFAYADDDPSYAEEPTTKLLLAAAVYDEIPDGQGMDKSKHNGLDIPDGVSDTAYWNKDAIKTLYPKSSPISLGYVNDGALEKLDITEFEKYPGEFAGKWLKVCVKARCTSKIDSQWTDQDATDESLNYKWIHIPGINLDDVNLDEMDSTDEDGVEHRGGVVRYFYDGTVHDSVPEDENIEYASLTQKTLRFSENKILCGYQLGIVLKTKDSTLGAPAYELYIQKHYEVEDNEKIYDGSWDVYIAKGSNAADITNAEELANYYNDIAEEKNLEIPICEFDENAVFVGNIGRIYEAMNDSDVADDEEFPLHIDSGIINLEDICGSYLSYKCSMQLRYEDGIFYVVLPDLIDVNGAGSNNNPSYYITERIMVSPFLSATQEAVSTYPYVIRKGKIFVRINNAGGNTTEISDCDAIKAKDWLAELGISLTSQEAETYNSEDNTAVAGTADTDIISTDTDSANEQ